MPSPLEIPASHQHVLARSPPSAADQRPRRPPRASLMASVMTTTGTTTISVISVSSATPISLLTSCLLVSHRCRIGFDRQQKISGVRAMRNVYWQCALVSPSGVRLGGPTPRNSTNRSTPAAGISAVQSCRSSARRPSQSPPSCQSNTADANDTVAAPIH